MPKKIISNYSRGLQNKIKLLQKKLDSRDLEIALRDDIITKQKNRIETQGNTIQTQIEELCQKESLLEGYRSDVEAFKSLERNWAESLDKSQSYKKQHETERDTAFYIIERITRTLVNGG